MDWTILTLIGAVLLIAAEAVFGWNIPSLLRAVGLGKAADWLYGVRSCETDRSKR